MDIIKNMVKRKNNMRINAKANLNNCMKEAAWLERLDNLKQFYPQYSEVHERTIFEDKWNLDIL